MADVALKSAGQLVDELITNAFKFGFATLGDRPTAEFEVRYQKLRAALRDRCGHDLAAAIHDLCIVSLGTWQAQEIVMGDDSDPVVAEAARQAQRLNARRTALIREIDRILGESHITITTKTYG